MKNYDRIFVIVLDSLGIGAMPVLKVTRRLWLTFNKDEACSRVMNTLRAFVCGVFCILPKRGKG